MKLQRYFLHFLLEEVSTGRQVIIYLFISNYLWAILKYLGVICEHNKDSDFLELEFCWIETEKRGDKQLSDNYTKGKKKNRERECDTVGRELKSWK